LRRSLQCSRALALTDAAPHLVAFIVGRLAKGLEGMTEFDDIPIAILPIVEGGEILTNGLEIRQAILAYARAYGSGSPNGPAASITRAGIWREELEFVRLPLPVLRVRRRRFFHRNVWPDFRVFGVQPQPFL
jgi:hypothetical protein